MDCIFCNLEEIKVTLENEGAQAIFDSFPVNEGHMLIIPKKHVETYFEASESEKKLLWDLVEECKVYLDGRFNPDGYNIGINNGITAGQSIMHLHIHLIPRYVGDIDNPKGGVRGVIPSKRIY